MLLHSRWILASSRDTPIFPESGWFRMEHVICLKPMRNKEWHEQALLVKFLWSFSGVTISSSGLSYIMCGMLYPYCMWPKNKPLMKNSKAKRNARNRVSFLYFSKYEPINFSYYLNILKNNFSYL